MEIKQRNIPSITLVPEEETLEKTLIMPLILNDTSEVLSLNGNNARSVSHSQVHSFFQRSEFSFSDKQKS